MHGNVGFMHCSNEDEGHADNFFKCPTLKDFEEYKQHLLDEVGAEESKNKTLVPKCEVCGSDMKTHTMFFDECYSERYYRSESIKSFYNDADVLIVVGTALVTNLASRSVYNMLAKEKPVIEINIETAIDKGNNI